MRHGVLVGAGMACLACGSARAEIVIVHVFNWDFSVNPKGEAIVDPVITLGDTIRFQFDDAGHTATSLIGNPDVFNFAGSPGQSFDHVFTNVGAWQYYCSPHGTDNGDGTATGMVGTVTVQVPGPGGAAVLACAGLMAARRRR